MFMPQTFPDRLIFHQPIAYVAGTGKNILRLKSASRSGHKVIVQQTDVAGISTGNVNGFTLLAPKVYEPLPPTALELQARLRSRWPAVIARARELQKTSPNPVQSIIDLLGNLPGDYVSWREIMEEPYG